MPEILIRVKASYDCDYGDDISQETVTLEQLLKENSSHMKAYGYVCIDPKNGIDQNTADFLRSHGWAHIETAKNREEEKIFEQEYYLYDVEELDYLITKRLRKIDVDNLSEYELNQLAKSGKIVQVVQPKSVLSSTQYNKLRKKQKLIEQKKDAAKKAAATRLANKKQKQIEAAKKLLAESGEDVN